MLSVVPRGSTTQSAPSELVAFAEDLGAESYSSLPYDMTHGKRMGLDWLHGVVRWRAADHGVDIPVTDVVYAILEP